MVLTRSSGQFISRLAIVFGLSAFSTEAYLLVCLWWIIFSYRWIFFWVYFIFSSCWLAKLNLLQSICKWWTWFRSGGVMLAVKLCQYDIKMHVFTYLTNRVMYCIQTHEEVTHIIWLLGSVHLFRLHFLVRMAISKTLLMNQVYSYIDINQSANTYFPHVHHAERKLGLSVEFTLYRYQGSPSGRRQQWKLLVGPWEKCTTTSWASEHC